ncbi:MAG: glycosyltransferase [Pseudomonadota bacterium]
MGLYGAERWILALIKYLDPTRIDTFVCVIQDAPGLELELIKKADHAGFRTIVIDSPGRFAWGAVFQLKHHIKDIGIDILHTHGYKQDIIGYFATLGTPCRCISTPHGWSRDAGMKLWLYESLNRLFFPFFDAVAPLSPDLVESIRYIPLVRKKTVLIPNGVDVNEILAVSTVDRQLKEWKEQGFNIIGYIGQLIHRKGLDTLLRAVCLIPDLKLKIVLVGDGEQNEYLASLARSLGIADNVEFMGFKEERLSLLKGFDIFVLPSRLEGIPRCLMEAMVAGIPIVASDIPGCKDLVENNRSGLLFKVDDPRGLADSVEFMIHRPDMKAFFARNARDSVFAHYSASRMARDYLNLYLSVSR